MSLYTFFGCLFTAYGPILSIFFLFIARNAQHVLLTVASVAIQELFRWFYFLLIQLAGYGYALTTSLVSYISLLVQSIGPGIIVCPSCPNASIFFISAITTTLFSLLHMVWMTIAFDGYASKSWIGYIKITWVIISHYGASYSTLMNSSPSIPYGCVYAILIELLILIISCCLIIHSLNIKHPIQHHQS
ncbi:Aph-1 protein-domain-containing protein [Cunninghamella echinulata]|nr:Aph-1 protein-domain-containing protein [Cunninghamella echinulata]